MKKLFCFILLLYYLPNALAQRSYPILKDTQTQQSVLFLSTHSFSNVYVDFIGKDSLPKTLTIAYCRGGRILEQHHIAIHHLKTKTLSQLFKRKEIQEGDHIYLGTPPQEWAFSINTQQATYTNYEGNNTPLVKLKRNKDSIDLHIDNLSQVRSIKVFLMRGSRVLKEVDYPFNTTQIFTQRLPFSYQDPTIFAAVVTVCIIMQDNKKLYFHKSLVNYFSKNED